MGDRSHRELAIDRACPPGSDGASARARDYLSKGGNSGLDYLLARQQDDGSIWYSKQSDQTRVWVTADALIAICR